ncbi:MAG: phosphonate ABC transporter, permease protein PhnE [Hyphomicrobiales bacterium]|nr:phosphonate ABC transporter, permease protein PhnE [Hyphomicrobiales bacterium]
MVKLVAVLPDRQVAPLLRVYGAAVRTRRLRGAAAVAVAAICIAVAAWSAGIEPSRLFEHVGRFTSYFDRLLRLDSGARVWTGPAEWLWGWRRWLRLLGDTVLMAYVGTCLGAVGAFLLSFFAAENLARSGWSRFLVRRSLEFCRTVPDLVFALVFVVAFGLGPVPGVLAIAIHSLGSLGKQFFEVVENIEMAPVAGLEATGAGFAAIVRFAVLPQVLPGFASYALLRFEINVRGATVLGFVGAGGVGQDLIEAIRKFYYSDVSAILLMIIATVVLLDVTTERLRRTLSETPQ